MKRPILVAVIGYIIGIIMGLYFKFSVAFLYAFIFLITASLKKLKAKFKYIKKQNNSILLNQNQFKVNNITNQKSNNKKFNFFSVNRFLRYFKLILNKKVIILIILSSLISNFIVIEKNKKYDELYKNIEKVEITGIIVSDKDEKEYKNVYNIEVISVNNSKNFKNTNLYINVDKKINLSYGDLVNIKGKFKNPDSQRNYGGFDYKEYLKTKNIYGTVNVNNIKTIDKNKGNIIFTKIYEIREKIKNEAKKFLKQEEYSIFLGLILGDTSNIDDQIQENFQNSNMSHILAISGMHISYIIIGITILLNKTIGKRKSKIITIFILIMYIMLTGFSPSIIRASLMGVIVLIGGIIHRKSDTWTSMAISLFIILIYNPYLITNIGLQFSYIGTIGIILFNKNILKLLNKGKKNESKIKEILSVTISAQICLLPLILFHLNTFGIYFLITNILISFIIGPIIIIGFIFLIFIILKSSYLILAITTSSIISLLLNSNLSIIILIINFLISIISIILNWGVQTILLISKVSMLPFAKIYLRTPTIFEIIIYYLIVIIINFIYSALSNKNPSITEIRVKYTLELLKYNYKKHKKKCISTIILCVFITTTILIFIPKNLQIHFVDVGQGDSCFVVTPNNKTLLIDGGGSEFGSFDVGKNTLVPYILDRGYTKIDYILISHFDSDHVRWTFNTD